MTPDRIESLRAEFERACAESDRLPPMERLESGEYRTAYARAMFRGWCLAHAWYCEGEATAPGDATT